MVLTTNSFSEAFSVFDAYGLINIKHSFLQVTQMTEKEPTPFGQKGKND